MADLILPDPRMEMPELFEPGRKPVGPVEIDWDHPLARGLLFADIGGGDLATSAQPELLLGAARERGDYAFDGTDSKVDYGDLAQVDGLAKMTAMSSLINADGNNAGVFSKRSDTGNGSWQVWDFSGKVFARIYIGGVANSATGTSTRPVGAAYTAGLWYDGATLRAIYNNGFEGSLSVSGTIDNTSDSVQLGWSFSDAYSLSGSIQWAFVWNRALSSSEVALVHKNPYQFLIPA
jgi:hypothetical protein